MTRIVYITGCLGFIGSYVTEECLKRGWYVTGIDKITYAARPQLIFYFKEKYKDLFRFIHQDINDIKIFAECDYVINLAAETHVDNSIVSSEDFLKSNINGVHNILEILRTKSIFDIPTLIHFSTDEVYGDITEGSHVETDLLKPSNPYSSTKAAADMLILAWARTFEIPYVIVRPTNNYGIGQYIEKLIPKACKSILLKRPIPLHNNGTPQRTWLHAGDTANAIIKIIESNIKNEIFNISGNYTIQNIEIIKKVVKSITGNDNIEPYCDFSYSRNGQDVRYSIDDTKLRNLGWNNVYELDKELPSIIEFYKNNFIW